MLKNKYEETLNRLKLYFPETYRNAVEWCATGPMCITVRLRDGTAYEYNQFDDSIRQIRTDTYIDETNTKEFGRNLQKYIQLSGMTQAEFANKIEITNAMLSRYIHGTSIPSVIKARRIADVLGCSVDELFDSYHI